MNARWIGWAALLWLAACRPTDPTPSTAPPAATPAHDTSAPSLRLAVVNARGVVLSPTRRLVFDAYRRPRIRICGSAPGASPPDVAGLEVAWRGEAPVVGAIMAPFSLGGCAFVDTTWSMPPAFGPGRIHVRLGGMAFEHPVVWVPDLTTDPLVAQYMARARAIYAGPKDDADSAHAALITDLLAAIERADADARWRLLTYRAQVLADVGRRVDGVASLSDAADAALESGQSWAALVALQRAAFQALTIVEPGHGDTVRRLIARIQPLAIAADDTIRLGWSRYLSGWDFVRRGLVEQGLEVLERAAHDAKQVGDRRLLGIVRGHRSLALITAGRYDEALRSDDRLRQALAADATAPHPAYGDIERAALLQNIEWNLMDAIEAGAVPSARISAVRLALDNLPDPPIDAMRANLEVDRARAALLADDAADARLHLDRGRALSPDGGGFDARYVDLLDAEIALAGAGPDAALARVTSAEASAATGGCDAYRGWALFIRSRARLAQGARDEALRLAHASVAFGLGWRPLHLLHGDARPLNHTRARAHAFDLTLRARGAGAALALLDRMWTYDQLGQRVRQHLARQEARSTGEPERVALIDRVQRACAAQAGAGDPLAGSPIPILRDFVEDDVQPDDTADAAPPLPPGARALIARARLGQVWHGLRVDGEGTTHAVLAGGRWPAAWLADGPGRLYIIEPVAVPDGADTAAAPDRVWLPTARPRPAPARAEGGLVTPSPLCPARVGDPWSVTVRWAGSDRRAPVHGMARPAARALVATCGALDPAGARRLARALIAVGVGTVDVSPPLDPGPARAAIARHAGPAGSGAATPPAGWRRFSTLTAGPASP